MTSSLDDAVAIVRAFVAERHPTAALVFLGGSWAAGSAHADSDLDLVIVDDTAGGVAFEGTTFGGFVVEACVLPSKIAGAFFRGSAKHRSAPIPAQVAYGLLILGDEDSAAAIRRSAKHALAAGPKPLSEQEIDELRYELSLLLVDLKHAKSDTLTAISAYAHVALSKAVIDLGSAWRADRKALRKTVATLDREFAEALDAALVQACAGSRDAMVKLCESVLDSIGGPKRTYAEFSV